MAIAIVMWCVRRKNWESPWLWSWCRYKMLGAVAGCILREMTWAIGVLLLGMVRECDARQLLK